VLLCEVLSTAAATSTEKTLPNKMQLVPVCGAETGVLKKQEVEWLS